MDLATRPYAMAALAVVAFVESSIFPIPPDVMLIPMILAAPTRAFRIALVCTIASVLGGMFGYGIGYFLFDAVGQPILDFYGYGDKFETFSGQYNEWGPWIVFTAGLTPFPYKVITITSGVTALDPVVFMTASIAARALRFYIVAALLWKFGAPIKEFIDKRLGILTVVFVILLVGGFVLVKYIAPS